MSRALAEWIATHDDQAVPARVKLRIWDRCEGRCRCGCDRKIMPGDKSEYDHIKALINGGEHREGNLQLMLAEHHKKKSKDDLALKTYNYRRRLANAGIKRRKSRPMLGSRDSAWKVTFGRGAVRR